MRVLGRRSKIDVFEFAMVWEWAVERTQIINGTLREMIVDWGDGSIEVSGGAPLTHTYTGDGPYIVRLAGDADNVALGLGVTEFINLGRLGLTSYKNLLKVPDVPVIGFGSNFDSSTVVDMSYALYNHPSLVVAPDLSGFDTSSVTTMASMLRGWSAITTPPDLSSFDTSKVTDMGKMMFNWGAITTPPDLTNFDTSKVTNMAYMMFIWKSITTPPDLSNFDTSSVTNMGNMMGNWNAITTPPNLTNFDTSKVMSMLNMMGGWGVITTPPDLSGFDTSSVNNMLNMMYDWNSITTPPDLSNFDTSKVTNMGNMMGGWNSITTPPDLSNFDTSKVTNMSNMMGGWNSITTPPDLSGFDTSSVNNMVKMVSYCGADISDIGIEDFNIASLIEATDFAKGSTILTPTYDKILINWQGQPHQKGVEIHFGQSKYSSAAAAARAALVADGWLITDLGLAVLDGADNPSIVSAIPAMTGDNTPSGICSASSITNKVTEAWEAVDADETTATYWQTEYKKEQNCWWKYQFTSQVAVNKVQMRGWGANRTPTDFTIQGSDDGSAWTVLHSVTDNPNDSVLRDYTFINSIPYLYYKLHCTRNSSTAHYTGIAVIKFIKAQGT